MTKRAGRLSVVRVARLARQVGSENGGRTKRAGVGLSRRSGIWLLLLLLLLLLLRGIVLGIGEVETSEGMVDRRLGRHHGLDLSRAGFAVGAVGVKR